MAQAAPTAGLRRTIYQPKTSLPEGPCRFIPRSIPTSSDFARNAEAMRGAGRRAARQARPGRRRRRRGVARAAHLARQDAGARARRPADRSRHRVSRIVAAGGPRPLWRRRAFGEHHHRRRADLGPRMRHRRQRCHHQGRHLLSDDGEEASARAGYRAAEQSALRLHGGFRRRLPAACRTRSFPTSGISAASSTIRRRCRRRAFRRSRS